jgi:DDE superfamily endonuclease
VCTLCIVYFYSHYPINTGLCLFGDNAYINTEFMATPYPATRGGTPDAYNFYHSQLRINIECAFGRLVHRWAVLRSAMPQNVTLAKTTALVVALTKLHNFCIDESDVTAPQSIARDNHNGIRNGAVPLLFSERADMPLPVGLLGGGNHRNDMDANQRRSREAPETGRLPRDSMHQQIIAKGLKRPAPTRKRH